MATPVKLKLLPRSTIKAKTLTNFPVQVIAGDGIEIDKSGGTYTISLTPTDLGLAADGVTDDSTVINAAINAVYLDGGGTVTLPAGTTIAVASSINLKQGVTLSGGGTGIAYAAIGVTQPTPAATIILWTGGVTGSVISSPAAMNCDMGIRNLTINGAVASGSLATSALKGIKLGSTLNTKFEKIAIENVGVGISFEPGFGVASPPLISWSSFYDIQMLNVGTGISFCPNDTLPLGSGGATNNYFYNLVIYEYKNHGLKFCAHADDNRFHGAYLTSSTVGSIGIEFNTLDPTNNAGVYSNSMVNFEIECNSAGSGAGIYSIKCNKADFGTQFHGLLANDVEGVQLGAGANITVVDDYNANYPEIHHKTTNNFVGLSVQNHSTGGAAFSGIDLGNSADSTIGRLQVNGAGNSTLGGINSLSLGTYVNTKMVRFTNNTLWETLSTAGAFRWHAYGAGIAHLDSSGNVTSSAVDLSGADATGTLAAARMPALTGDITTSAGAVATTLATVNSNVGTFGSATQSVQFTANGKGLVTAAAAVTITPAVGSITGLGTGIATALAVNVGTAGSPVVNGGALGSPSSAGTLPAYTLGGTVSGGGNQINNVIIGTSTPLAGSFTTLSATGRTTIGAALVLSGIIAPTQITSNQNNYAPTGLATAGLMQISSDAARDITGLSSSGFAVGQVLVINNVGNFNITLKFNSGSSSAGNQFLLTGAADFVLTPFDSIRVYWNGSFFYKA